jgi:hypothetical protein
MSQGEKTDGSLFFSWGVYKEGRSVGEVPFSKIERIVIRIQ